MNELRFIYSQCHGDNKWHDTLSMVVYRVEYEQEHRTSRPDRHCLVLNASVGPDWNLDLEKCVLESRSFLKLIDQNGNEAIKNVNRKEEMLLEMDFS